MNPLYELVPITEKPKKSCAIMFITELADELCGKTQHFSKRLYEVYPETFDEMAIIGGFTHWLRPIDPETLKARIREELGNAFDAGWWKRRADLGDHAKLTNYPDRETYINSVIDKLFEK